MMTLNRVDSSGLTKAERECLPRLVGAIERDCPRLVVGGEQFPMPEVLAKFFVAVVRDLSRGKSVVVVPEDETFTTQAAAGVLGMSRQYFVTLLEKGEIPFHKVGSHRRVTFKHLMQFKARRDGGRRKRLDKLFDEVEAAGVYESSSKYTGRGNAGS
jgi:excisionase family DNA binding protein